MFAVLHRVERVWDAVQVELQGQYSLERLRELLEYESRHSLDRPIVVALATALPCLVTIISMEALPMVSTTQGIPKQTFSFWFRSWFTGWIMTFMIIKQICQCTPSLPMTNARLWCISSFIAAALLPSAYAMMIFIGFPVPFALQLQTTPWFIMMCLAMWLSWKDTIRVDAVARYNLQRYIEVFNSQVLIILAYVAFNLLYHLLTSKQQTGFTFVLPFMKLFFKNWVSRGVYHLEDLAPTTIVFNVDVFHSLFVASTMQQTTSNGTIVGTMIVDLVQALIAYGEVYAVVTRVTRQAQESHALDAKANMANSRTATDWLRAKILFKQGAIFYALHILDARPRVRNHWSVAQPRHLRKPSATTTTPPGPSAGMVPAHGPTGRNLDVQGSASTRVFPTQKNGEDAARLSELETAQLASARSVLKMLHMVEFYVLIEFVEVVMAVVYSVYLVVMTYLPNREFNLLLCHHTKHQLLTTAGYVAFYASLEFVSFVVFCFVIDRKLQHFSCIRLLGFVLEKHWFVVQTTLVMWVYFVVQVPLEHFGADFTFEFEWLRNSTRT